MVRRRAKKHGPSKKRIIRSSKNGPSDKTTKKDDPVDSETTSVGASETASNIVTDEDYRIRLEDTGNVAVDDHTAVSESYAKAQELMGVLFSGGLGITPSVKIRKLLAVIDARFRELMLTRAMFSRPRRRDKDVNQTFLFDRWEEKHD